ncbi:tRNA (N6-isopentenyl adenosine(37)-C2)-methylthiotransferase MiaB [Desulfohalovibrio reitneri]|uniref:tRNA (N6-isopentenyl adenosine(37)-C2)-methylthiotransferase MiaB n=1 Tax=Desulfohalovibrio reitneri TaxID=1307759 RepID=UPI0004A6D495|nr:tRNA (N6-isopentenyl adenosine(37)-C2)-methylthiotransferase MiaB [Desulfohalovibrio reitneri]
MRFHIHTFGCQMNAGDSRWLARALRARGWEEVESDQAAAHVINTCSVRAKPEEKVASLAGRLAPVVRRNDPERGFVAVGGCVAQQKGAWFLERFPHVRLVFGADGLAGAPGAMQRVADDPAERLSLLDFADGFLSRPAYWEGERVPPQAFVTIMQGCDNYCAYCIVPYVRGRQKSRPSAEILAECRELAAKGAREITLLGQNVNAYGLDPEGDGTGFAGLLRAVTAIPGVDRLRFTTSHPKDLSDEVVAAFGELNNLAPNLHLPMQAGSDRVLRRMGRRYDTARYLSLVEGLRAARPDITLSTDLIVGFPGETEEEFQQTLDLVAHVGFESSFSFKYNDRPGVAAERMEGKVPEEIKADRLARLQALQDELTEASYAARVGAEADVLFEGASRKPDPDGGVSWMGRDPWGRVVNMPSENGTDLTGSIARVTIIEAKKHSLSAKPAGSPW